MIERKTLLARLVFGSVSTESSPCTHHRKVLKTALYNSSSTRQKEERRRRRAPLSSFLPPRNTVPLFFPAGELSSIYSTHDMMSPHGGVGQPSFRLLSFGAFNSTQPSISILPSSLLFGKFRLKETTLSLTCLVFFPGCDTRA